VSERALFGTFLSRKSVRDWWWWWCCHFSPLAFIARGSVRFVLVVFWLLLLLLLLFGFCGATPDRDRLRALPPKMLTVRQPHRLQREFSSLLGPLPSLSTRQSARETEIR
jgi:hypothetical protein